MLRVRRVKDLKTFRISDLNTSFSASPGCGELACAQPANSSHGVLVLISKARFKMLAQAESGTGLA